MNLLIPGRHQLLTDFQFKYLYRIIQAGIAGEKDVRGNVFESDEKVEGLIFAVTSANHSNTRRNPLPFYLRAISIHEFAKELNVPAYIYGIDDVGALDNFATYTLKRIKHESDGRFDLASENTLVVCSTPVLHMYEKLGFRVLPAELENISDHRYSAELPWDIVEHIAMRSMDWKKDKQVISKMHPSSYKVWVNYNIGNIVKVLFQDKIISDDGDITTTRDYNTYVRQMDQIAELKYSETSIFIKPGRIGDIGCAVGSWIKLASKEELLRESDFYGIEVARHLFDICQQRKHNGEFTNPFVFFAQKNAVTGIVFEESSMNTIHTSSLTHEIESYGSREDLLKFIHNRYNELVLGGVWINRDVVGPENKEDEILMLLNEADGRNEDFDNKFDRRQELAQYLEGLSTYARFLRFGIDFRQKEGYQLKFNHEIIDGVKYIRLKLKDACEFMSRKDYVDNWESEMHETFCFWSFTEWKDHLKSAGFYINPRSSAFSNSWIIKHRLEGKVSLYTYDGNKLEALPFPVTNMLLIAEKV